MPQKEFEIPFDKIQRSGNEAVAIVGIGCRFPGASSPDAFWHLLCDGIDAITEIPTDRFDITHLYDPQPAKPGKIVTRWGGFLENIDQFDSTFFGISPREAANLDPQSRLLLEVTWEALEDAGEIPEKLAGSQTGVFIGETYNDYEDLQTKDLKSINIYSITGGSRSILAGRLSYAFDLRGPSLTIDTACSSSLVAIHLACQSLWSGESSLAMAGGVNLILQPEFSIGFSQAGMLAPDGRCKAFDASANGFVRSEGIGIVILKPLSQAQADGNPIYAIIRGSAVANDGLSSGSLMTPGQKGQEQTLRSAYRSAGVDPGMIQYIEAHGTGTSVGDPIEVAALAAVIGEGRTADHYCNIGSVKTNIGHTEAASGVAGLIKTALSLKNRLIPPSLHFRVPNPSIPWSSLPLEVPYELKPWSVTSGTALAGISSFGISGTNAHVVLEEYPQNVPPVVADSRPQILTLSTRSAEALRQLAQAYQQSIGNNDEAVSLYNLCYTANVRRTHHDHRLAVIASSLSGISEKLETFLSGVTSPEVISGRSSSHAQHRLVFVFPGQGSQWIGMGKRLLEQEPVFRVALEQCEQAMQPYVRWSLLKQLMGEDEHSYLQDIDCIQPTLFAIQVALAALWQSWGIIPDAVVGHSMGEVAAAYIAGILSLDDATRIICRRSALLKRVSGRGAMAVVGLSLDDAQQIIAGYEDRLATAVSNSPTTTVISGDQAALQEVLTILQQRNIFYRPIKVDVASHSPQMDPLLEDLSQILQGIHPCNATIPLYSTVTNTIGEGPEFDATYWVRNLRSPVLFSKAVQHLLEDQYDIFIEISPHPILTSPLQQCLQYFARDGLVLASLRRDEDERTMLLEALGALHIHGVPIEWSKIYTVKGRCITLPSYPWQRERCWYNTGRSSRQVNEQYRSNGVLAHPFLQQYLHLATRRNTYCWETTLDLDNNDIEYLDDHRVLNNVVFPAAAYIEMALAATVEAFENETSVIQEIQFYKAIFLQPDCRVRLQLVLEAKNSESASFQFFVLPEDNSDLTEQPVLHASGKSILRISGSASITHTLSLPAIQQRCQEVIEGKAYYQTMLQHGLMYGPAFQNVEQIWRSNGEAIARLHLHSTLSSEADKYQIHPALLDSCFQVLLAALPSGQSTVFKETEGTYLPIYLHHLHVIKKPGRDVWAYARLKEDADPSEHIQGDLFILDDNGEVLVAAHDLRLQRIDSTLEETSQRSLQDWFYAINWEQTSVTELTRPPVTDQQESWLIFSDHTGIGDGIIAMLKEHGQRCICVYPGDSYCCIALDTYQLPAISVEAFSLLLADISPADQPPLQHIVHLWSLETTRLEVFTEDTLTQLQEPGCISVLHLLQALAKAEMSSSPQLLLITQGAQSVDETVPPPQSIFQASLWGMGRVIGYEHPELQCRLIDLSITRDDTEIATLYQEIRLKHAEEQVVLRGLQRYVARLIPHSIVEETSQEAEAPIHESVIADANHPFRVEISTPGLLDTLTLCETVRSYPHAGEIEIKVYAAGLNFHDVMLAMGIDIGEEHHGAIPLGLECSGVVTALGEGVTQFSVGDPVIALAPFSLGLYVIAQVALVVPKPDQLSFEEAVTIPAAFLTAYYALHFLGHMERGERVLIHAATGGVGMAAVQLAQLAGAEIFATAGNPEKRAFLRSLGIQHIMDSRSLEFAEDIMQQTHQQGVDIVLNSLAGEGLVRSVAVLGPYGRFLEIGKRDIFQDSQLGLKPFQKSLAFFAIDLDRLSHDRSALLGKLFHEVIELFAKDKLRPLPLKVFSVKEVTSAFRYMVQARHLGKIVISLQDEHIPIAPLLQKPTLFKKDATYLITGGLGGIGLTVANWMVQNGARYLVLLGRSGPSIDAQQVIEQMQHDAQILTIAVDMTQKSQVVAAMETIAQSLPPLKGVIHGAGILDDGTIIQLDQQRLLSVMAPKVLGAWYLHQYTKNIPLDFFLLFSSAAGLLGSPGQGNYSAGNTFLDALAHARHLQGLPALSINWGPWTSVGLAAAQSNRGERLFSRGFGAITPEHGLQALTYLLTKKVPQIAVMPFHLQQWCQFYPVANKLAFFTRLLTSSAYQQIREKSFQQENLRRSIFEAPAQEQQEMVETYLNDRVAKVLGFTQRKLDVHLSLNRIGIDSLMAVELRNAIENDLGIVIPVIHFLKGDTLRQLALEVLNQLVTEKAETSLESGEQPQPASFQQEVDQLLDQEVDVLLNELLATSDIETLLQQDKAL